MKIAILITASFLMLFPPTARSDAPVISTAKAEMIGRVEDFFLHNFRDVTWRKSLNWSDMQTGADGVRSITYNYEAKIWDKETMVMSQVFSFAADGKFVKYKDAA